MKNTLILWVSLFTLVILPNLSHASNKDLQCLAQNIYYEAGAEPLEGKLAVAQVTLNRVENPSFPKTICDVVHQKSTRIKTEWDDAKTICQFSWVCNPRKTIYKESDNWQESLEVAKLFLTENKYYDKFGSNVLYFHEKHLPFNWKERYQKVAVIGNHIFYRTKNT